MRNPTGLRRRASISEFVATHRRTRGSGSRFEVAAGVRSRRSSPALSQSVRHPISWFADKSHSPWNARRDVPVDVWNPAPHSSAVSDRRCRLPRPFREIVVFARLQTARFDDCADRTADVHRSFGHQYASFRGCTASRSSHSSFLRLELVQTEVRRQRSHPGRRTVALMLDQG